MLIRANFFYWFIQFSGHLVEKLRTEALWQLRKQKRGRHLWRKAQKQPKPDSCSLLRPREASPKAPQESVLRRRICPDICAQNTWERGRFMNIRYCCLKLLSDLVSCVSGQFPVSHILLHLLHLLPVDWVTFKQRVGSQDFKKEPVLAPGWVKGLNKVCGMAKEHCIAGGPAHHGQHRQPHVC